MKIVSRLRIRPSTQEDQDVGVKHTEALVSVTRKLTNSKKVPSRDQKRLRTRRCVWPRQFPGADFRTGDDARARKVSQGSQRTGDGLRGNGQREDVHNERGPLIQQKPT